MILEIVDSSPKPTTNWYSFLNFLDVYFEVQQQQIRKRIGWLVVFDQYMYTTVCTKGSRGVDSKATLRYRIPLPYPPLVYRSLSNFPQIKRNTGAPILNLHPSERCRHCHEAVPVDSNTDDPLDPFDCIRSADQNWLVGQLVQKERLVSWF
jgi:hypothetical protein